LSVTGTGEQLYLEREKRFMDAITLKKPDRVPVLALFGSSAAKYAGISARADICDVDAFIDANIRMNVDFEPDVATLTPVPGAVLEALDYRQIKWAGHGLPLDALFQYVEGEYMKAEEYDALLYDPSDYISRVYWPKVYGKLNALASLAPMRQAIGFFAPQSSFLAFGLPGAREALEALLKAGEEAIKGLKAMMGAMEKLKEVGFPPSFLSGTQAPFDFIGDFLRGRKGSMLDMYRRPGKLLAACEKLLPMAVETGVTGARMSGNPRVFIALHGCIEGFMSPGQFKKFYWPTFRELLVALVGAGLFPIVLVEGGSTSRLDVMTDVPEGKVCYIFEDVDMAKAKKVLGGKVCIAGNVPLSMLATGTPEDVRRYCKYLIDTVAEDGGYIMSSGGSMDDARPENMRAMIDFTKEYGVYA
jgi:hypothetical protein